ncbi:unnamed protein product, partial [Ectocarpus sp. 8 AP-2014]
MRRNSGESPQQEVETRRRSNNQSAQRIMINMFSRGSSGQQPCMTAGKMIRFPPRILSLRNARSRALPELFWSELFSSQPRTFFSAPVHQSDQPPLTDSKSQ